MAFSARSRQSLRDSVVSCQFVEMNVIAAAVPTNPAAVNANAVSPIIDFRMYSPVTLNKDQRPGAKLPRTAEDATASRCSDSVFGPTARRLPAHARPPLFRIANSAGRLAGPFLICA